MRTVNANALAALAALVTPATSLAALVALAALAFLAALAVQELPQPRIPFLSFILIKPQCVGHTINFNLETRLGFSMSQFSRAVSSVPPYFYY